MNAILEAPVLPTDTDEDCSAISNPQDAGLELTFAGTTFGDPEVILSADAAPPAGARMGCPKAAEAFHADSLPVGGEGLPKGAAASSRPMPDAQTLPRESPQEFDTLYHTYERRVYRQCYRMLGNQEDAEDLTQEVFLQLFRKADTFRGEASFSTWLHRLTVNTVLMQMRRYRRWRSPMTSLDAVPPSDDGANDYPAAVSTIPAPATSPMDQISLDVAIAKLSTGYKDVFLLHDWEGYRHDEIAELLGISEGTSKSQLHKARMRLRTLVGTGRSARHAGPGGYSARGRGKKRGDAAPQAECVLTSA